MSQSATLELPRQDQAAGRPAASPANPRRLAGNLLLLSGGEMLAKFLTFAAFSHLGRTLQAEMYGSLEFALAVMIFFTLPADLGLGVYGAREIAKDRSRAAELFARVVRMRLFLSAASFLALLVFLAFVPCPAGARPLLVLYGISLLGTGFLLQWMFQAYDQMHWVALASITRQLVFAAMVLRFFHAGSPLTLVGLCECASVLATACVCLAIARLRLRLPWPWATVPLPELTKSLWEAAPIGATELAWAFLWYFATVLLGLTFHDESLGWFGASHRLLMAMHTFVWLYFFNLLPSLSRCASLPLWHLRGLVDRSLRLAAWSSLLVAFLVTTLSREVMTIVFGPHFAGGASVLAVLSWMLPVAMLSGHHRYILIAYGHQSRLLWSTVAAAAAAVVLGFVLVPKFGALGAACALLAANLVNFALAYIAVRQTVDTIHFHRQMMRPLAALAIAVVLFYALSAQGIWLAAAGATLAYLGLMTQLEGRQLLALARLTRPAKAGLEEPCAG